MALRLQPSVILSRHAHLASELPLEYRSRDLLAYPWGFEISTHSSRQWSWVDLALGLVLLIGGSTWFYRLADGFLTRYFSFCPVRKVRLEDICKIAPHKFSNRWSNGLIVNVFSQTGRKLTIQAAYPEPFLTLLRTAAPQAQYLL